MADDSALARELAQFRSDLREDLTEIKDDLAKLLPREVYELMHKALADQVEANKAQIEAQAKDLKDFKESVKKERDAQDQKRRSFLMWAVGTAAIPIVIAAVDIIIQLRGS